MTNTPHDGERPMESNAVQVRENLRTPIKFDESLGAEAAAQLFKRT
ncbi:hypothetical protein AAFP35_25870 [Gordonia sp. CPCC 206044]